MYIPVGQVDYANFYKSLYPQCDVKELRSPVREARIPDDMNIMCALETSMILGCLSGYLQSCFNLVRDHESRLYLCQYHCLWQLG